MTYGPLYLRSRHHLETAIAFPFDLVLEPQFLSVGTLRRTLWPLRNFVRKDTTARRSLCSLQIPIFAKFSYRAEAPPMTFILR